MNRRAGTQPGLVAKAATMIVMIGCALAACGGDDSGALNVGANEGNVDVPTMVTLGELGLELPIVVPSDIPAPSDGVYAGENELAARYRAVQIGTLYDPTALRSTVRQFAETVGGNYDATLGRVTYVIEMKGVETGVYVSARKYVQTSIHGDTYSSLLEIGIVEVDS